MNATGLPIPSNTSVPAANAPAPANTAPAASDDFLLMLAQFLGGATAPAVPAASAAGGKAVLDTDKDTDSVEADGAALAAMLPFAGVAQPIPFAMTSGAGKGDGAVDVKALGLTGGSERAALDLLTADKPLDDNTSTNSNANPAATALIDNSQAARAPTGADPAGSRPLHNPVGTAAWADELGTRLTILAERGQHSASLRLSPEHLGPLEVRISVRDDQASVWFGAAHSDTRAAIEQALPRLRELFASQGLSLTDAGVFREPPREQTKLPQAFGSQAGGESGEDAQIVSIRSIRLGLVDAYA